MNMLHGHAIESFHSREFRSRTFDALAAETITKAGPGPARSIEEALEDDPRRDVPWTAMAEAFSAGVETRSAAPMTVARSDDLTSQNVRISKYLLRHLRQSTFAMDTFAWMPGPGARTRPEGGVLVRGPGIQNGYSWAIGHRAELVDDKTVRAMARKGLYDLVDGDKGFEAAFLTERGYEFLKTGRTAAAESAMTSTHLEYEATIGRTSRSELFRMAMWKSGIAEGPENLPPMVFWDLVRARQSARLNDETGDLDEPYWASAIKGDMHLAFSRAQSQFYRRHWGKETAVKVLSGLLERAFAAGVTVKSMDHDYEIPSAESLLPPRQVPDLDRDEDRLLQRMRMCVFRAGLSTTPWRGMEPSPVAMNLVREGGSDGRWLQTGKLKRVEVPAGLVDKLMSDGFLEQAVDVEGVEAVTFTRRGFDLLRRGHLWNKPLEPSRDSRGRLISRYGMPPDDGSGDVPAEAFPIGSADPAIILEATAVLGIESCGVVSASKP